MNVVQSSEQKFLSKINSLLEGIRKNTPVNRFVLCRMYNVTPRQYSTMHSYLVEGYGDKVEFNPHTKNWTWIGKKKEDSPKENVESIDFGVVEDE